MLSFLSRTARDLLALRSQIKDDWIVVFSGGFRGGGDGFHARVRLIDSILASRFGRIYVDTNDAGSPEPLRRLGERMILVSTRGDRISEAAVVELVRTAGRAYVHSLFGANARVLRRLSALSDIVLMWDAHGAVPEECTYRGAGSLAAKMEALERVVAHGAARIVTVSHAMAQHFRAKHSIAAERFILLPPASQSVPPTKRPLSFAYAGNVERWQGFSQMAEAIQASSLEAPFSLMLATPGTSTMDLDALARDPRVSITNETPDTVRERLTGFAYGFCLREDMVINRVACPTKLVDYLAAGVVPILASPVIGDFSTLGLQYLSLEDFHRGRLPPDEARLAMAQSNTSILEILADQAKGGSTTVLDVLNGR